MSHRTVIGGPGGQGGVMPLASYAGNLDTRRGSFTHEYRTFWRDVRSGSSRTSGAGAGGAGAVQTAPDSLCGGEHSSAQTAAAAFALRAPLCHAGAGHGRGEGVCAVVAGGAGGGRDADSERPPRKRPAGEAELYDRHDPPTEADIQSQ